MERRKYDEFNYVPQKKITQLPFLRDLYDWKSTSLHHIIIIETIII